MLLVLRRPGVMLATFPLLDDGVPVRCHSLVVEGIAGSSVVRNRGYFCPQLEFGHQGGHLELVINPASVALDPPQRSRLGPIPNVKRRLIRRRSDVRHGGKYEW